jgi:DNA-binding transcriptional regulator YhcF (GntR family)
LLSSNGLKETYGDAATEYLNSIGIRDYGYGSVETKTTETQDYYIAKELKTKIATSTLSKTEAVLAKRESGKKLNYGDSLVLKAYDMYKDLTLDKIIEEEKRINSMVRTMISIVANTTYSLLVSKSWFKDTDDTEMVINDNGYDVKCSVEVISKNIPI